MRVFGSEEVCWEEYDKHPMKDLCRLVQNKNLGMVVMQKWLWDCTVILRVGRNGQVRHLPEGGRKDDDFYNNNKGILYKINIYDILLLWNWIFCGGIFKDKRFHINAEKDVSTLFQPVNISEKDFLIDMLVLPFSQFKRTEYFFSTKIEMWCIITFQSMYFITNCNVFTRFGIFFK